MADSSARRASLRSTSCPKLPATNVRKHIQITPMRIQHRPGIHRHCDLMSADPLVDLRLASRPDAPANKECRSDTLHLLPGIPETPDNVVASSEGPEPDHDSI